MKKIAGLFPNGFPNLPIVLQSQNQHFVSSYWMPSFWPLWEALLQGPEQIRLVLGFHLWASGLGGSGSSTNSNWAWRVAN